MTKVLLSTIVLWCCAARLALPAWGAPEAAADKSTVPDRSGNSVAGTISAATVGTGHPFLLWTRDEAAAIRKRIETDETAKRQYERMQRMESKAVYEIVPGATPNEAMLRLFKFAVLGDGSAGEQEKRQLQSFIGSRPPQNKPGDPSSSNAAWRDDRTLDAWRYDVLYEMLSVEQREGVEQTIRKWVDWFIENPGPAVRPGATRVGWLPNMQWPTAIGIHNLALVSRDETLIRKVFEAQAGWKWFFDNYVADGRFYMEEFGKYYSNIGSMLLWCEGLERLGLPQYGYGYTSPSGANMRNFLEMLMSAGYPRVMRGANMPDYPSVHMGDAGALQVVSGRNKDGIGGDKWWRRSNMNGPIPKMYQPLWWEIGFRRFPDQGFGYFLAQMRAPGEDVYLPSLYFGLAGIDPARQTPPTVASYVAPTRAFAMLRAEESPSYWESPKPAVALQFAMYYMHYVHDCFCILQYVADNRFIYTKQGGVRGGYAGDDPYSDSPRGQGSGVSVDCRQIQPVDNGEEGCRNQRIRQGFSGRAKFVAIRAKPRVEDRDGVKVERALFSGIDAERALVLTDDYLFDLYHLGNDASTRGARVTHVTPANHLVVTDAVSTAADRSRVFDWHVQGWGRVAKTGEAPWVDSGELATNAFWDSRLTTEKGQKVPDLVNVRKKDIADTPCVETVIQSQVNGADAGVVVRLLPDSGTILYSFETPGTPAGSSWVLMARREGTRADFVALHEPFGGRLGPAKIERFERLAQTDKAIAVAVVGKAGSGIDDRILLRFGDNDQESITLGGNGEKFTFSDYVHIRVGTGLVEANGALRALRVRVVGSPALRVNDRSVDAATKGGMLEWTSGDR